jgi:hypothetical protein
MTSPWQPIATAPRDGTPVDLWIKSPWSDGARITDCTWCTCEKRWGCADGDFDKQIIILFWMPLPAPPTEGDGT